MGDSNKKEPHPGEEAASSSSSLPEDEYDARDEEWRKKKVKSLHDRLTDPRFHLRLPGTLLTAAWRVQIGGSSYPLLLILLQTSDWKQRRWHGNIFALAGVLGVSEKTVRNQLNRLKCITGFRVVKHPWSITIFLPERLYPPTLRDKSKQQDG